METNLDNGGKGYAVHESGTFQMKLITFLRRNCSEFLIIQNISGDLTVTRFKISGYQKIVKQT